MSNQYIFDNVWIDGVIKDETDPDIINSYKTQKGHIFVDTRDDVKAILLNELLKIVKKYGHEENIDEVSEFLMNNQNKIQFVTNSMYLQNIIYFTINEDDECNIKADICAGMRLPDEHNRLKWFYMPDWSLLNKLKFIISRFSTIFIMVFDNKDTWFGYDN